MAQEMGHGASMDMQAMVRDMRNRFWIALIFSLPIFVLSPMGLEFHSNPAAFRPAEADQADRYASSARDRLPPINAQGCLHRDR
jgi:hypothetical protein